MDRRGFIRGAIVQPRFDPTLAQLRLAALRRAMKRTEQQVIARMINSAFSVCEVES